MASGKNAGNLRDFRIDAVSAAQGTAANTRPAPRQSVKPRGHSITETHVSGGPNERMEDLWSSWEDDSGLQEPAPMPAAPVRTQNAPGLVETAPTPAELTMSAAAADEAAARVDNARRRQPWAVELATDERRMERNGEVDFTSQYGKQEILRARTLEFTATLREAFKENVELFNESRRSAAHSVNLYRVAKTEEDFMLFRNGVKLIVSGARAGQIVFAFNQYMGQLFAPTQTPTTLIQAEWGPFDVLFWSHKGERVAVLDIVRFFFTEFIRQSLK